MYMECFSTPIPEYSPLTVKVSDTPLPFLAITVPLKSWTLSFDLPFFVSVMIHPTITESPTEFR